MNRLWRGGVAGLAGTVALSALSAGETRWRGHPAVYEPSLMADRLARRWLGAKLTPDQRRWAGAAMRGPYGMSWGVAFGSVAAGRRWWGLWGLALGASVLGFEVVALPATGATPRLRHWGRNDLVLDALNTLVYGLTSAAVLRALQQLPTPARGTEP